MARCMKFRSSIGDAAPCVEWLSGNRRQNPHNINDIPLVYFLAIFVLEASELHYLDLFANEIVFPIIHRMDKRSCQLAFKTQATHRIHSLLCLVIGSEFNCPTHGYSSPCSFQSKS